MLSAFIEDAKAKPTVKPGPFPVAIKRLGLAGCVIILRKWFGAFRVAWFHLRSQCKSNQPVT